MLSQKNHSNFRLLTVTFEPRHENKSCSACRERVNETVKVVKVAKVVKVKVFQNIPGSQLLSDIQTFFTLFFTHFIKVFPQEQVTK